MRSPSNALYNDGPQYQHVSQLVQREFGQQVEKAVAEKAKAQRTAQTQADRKQENLSAQRARVKRH